MKLNRYVQPYGFDDSQILCHVYKAAEHAKLLLDIMNSVANRREYTGVRSPSSGASIEFTSPFVGYAIVAAVDILSARSTRAEIPSIINSFSGARSVIAEIAQFLADSKDTGIAHLEACE
ncbi:hypothetical protein DID88_002773 [Monilinia fructigena]|uniref:Uncharacterized protein n=1 Tax=Monilinia fructigena TaxID=38457 RepID=A0A395IN23_9HELO|nr:hypothetical protein DID88_002773 [Monilinia fructigena]